MTDQPYAQWIDVGVCAQVRVKNGASMHDLGEGLAGERLARLGTFASIERLLPANPGGIQWAAEVDTHWRGTVQGIEDYVKEER